MVTDIRNAAVFSLSCGHEPSLHSLSFFAPVSVFAWPEKRLLRPEGFAPEATVNKIAEQICAEELKGGSSVYRRPPLKLVGAASVRRGALLTADEVILKPPLGDKQSIPDMI
ncbi:uncharacterized protein V6R79_017720 [Siganus canaliculatus]